MQYTIKAIFSPAVLDEDGTVLDDESLDCAGADCALQVIGDYLENPNVTEIRVWKTGEGS